MDKKIEDYDWRSDYLRNFYYRYTAKQRPLLERGPSCKQDSLELKQMYNDCESDAEGKKSYER